MLSSIMEHSIHKQSLYCIIIRLSGDGGIFVVEQYYFSQFVILLSWLHWQVKVAKNKVAKSNNYNFILIKQVILGGGYLGSVVAACTGR